MKKFTAYILAGGAGSRLWPFNEFRNKAALPIGNAPLARRTADAALAAGAEKVVIAGDRFMGELRSVFLFDERVCVVETKPCAGSAATLAAAVEACPPEGELLILFGDCLYFADELEKLAASRGDDTLTALVSPIVTHGDSTDWISAAYADGLLRGFAGHRESESYRVAEAFLASPEFMKYVKANSGIFSGVGVGDMPPREAFVEESAAELIRREGPQSAVEGSRVFCDIDKPWHIMEACWLMEQELCNSLTENVLLEGASIDPTAEINGFVRLGKGSRIGRGCRINGSIWVGDGAIIDNYAVIDGDCLIGDRAEIMNYCYIDGGSTVGNRCKVLHCAEFGGVLFDGTYLYHYMEIDGLLGTHVDIGASTVCGTLRFDNASARHSVRGKKETPRNFANGTFIGDYSRTGVNVTFYPGVTVGCNSCIGPGMVVTEDIPSGTVALVKQEIIKKPWGPEKYQW